MTNPYTPEKVAELVAEATSAWETAGRIPQGTMVHETQWLPFANLYNVAESLIDALTAVSAERDASLDDLARAREVITRVSEYLVAVQNSPGLGKTGHHERWLREARDTLTTYDQAGDPR